MSGICSDYPNGISLSKTGAQSQCEANLIVNAIVFSLDSLTSHIDYDGQDDSTDFRQFVQAIANAQSNECSAFMRPPPWLSPSPFHVSNHFRCTSHRSLLERKGFTPIWRPIMATRLAFNQLCKFNVWRFCARRCTHPFRDAKGKCKATHQQSGEKRNAEYLLLMIWKADWKYKYRRKGDESGCWQRWQAMSSHHRLAYTRMLYDQRILSYLHLY